MRVGGVDVPFESGQSFEAKRTPEGQMRAPSEDDRRTAREEAVKKYRANAVRTTQLQIAQAATATVGLCIQLRALGGNFTDTDLADQLREIVEFMEDL